MKRIPDGSEILYDLYVRGDPDAEARVEQERKRIRLIAQLRELRERDGLSQADLARKLSMRSAEIAELEDPDSDSHSLEALQRIVSALGMELELKIVKKTVRKRRVATAGAA
ncbi:MAG TPA: XRE family transcriptional regulator [Planctomycetota bacterium]|nr:XRE family transcriptional regulator [Planctomycetota bacterium]